MYTSIFTLPQNEEHKHPSIAPSYQGKDEIHENGFGESGIVRICSYMPLAN